MDWPYGAIHIVRWQNGIMLVVVNSFLVTVEQQQADRRRRYRAHKKTRHTHKKRQRLPSSSLYYHVCACFLFLPLFETHLFMVCLSCEHGARFQGNELIVRISSPSRQNIIITIIIRCGADTVVDFPANSPVLLYTRIHLPAVGCFPPRLNAFRKKTSVAVARGGM